MSLKIKRKTLAKRLRVLVRLLGKGDKNVFIRLEQLTDVFGLSSDRSIMTERHFRRHLYVSPDISENAFNQFVDKLLAALEPYSVNEDDLLRPGKKYANRLEKKIKSVQENYSFIRKDKLNKDLSYQAVASEDLKKLQKQIRESGDKHTIGLLKRIIKDSPSIIGYVVATIMSLITRRAKAYPLFTACSLALIIAAAIYVLDKDEHQQTKADSPNITIPSKSVTIDSTNKTEVDSFGKSTSGQIDQIRESEKTTKQTQSRTEKYYDKWEKLDNVLELSDFHAVNNIIIDADDNIIVSGSRNEEHYGNTLYVSKYSIKNGQELWGKYLNIFDAQYGTNQFYNSIIDSDNNIYLSGNGKDVTGFFVKLDVNGKEEWHSFVGETKEIFYSTSSDLYVKNYKIFTVFEHTVSRIETDTIPGAKYTSLTPLYYVIFDPKTGVKEWQNLITDFYSLKTIVDSDGNLILMNLNFKNNNYQLTKIDNLGDIIWSKNLCYHQDALRTPICLYADHENNIYLVLHSRNKEFDDYDNIGNTDAYIFKYNSNGQLLWKQHYGTKYSDHLYYILVTNNNTIYIAGGGIYGNPIDPEDEGDLIVLCLNSKGEHIYKIVEGEKGKNEGIFDIALDNNEELFILGYSEANQFVAKIKK